MSRMATIARVAVVELLLRLQLVQGLLIGALGLLDLAFGRQDVGLRNHLGRVDLGDFASRGLDRRFLLRAVQPEQRRPFVTGPAEVQHRSRRRVRSSPERSGWS